SVGRGAVPRGARRAVRGAGAALAYRSSGARLLGRLPGHPRRGGVLAGPGRPHARPAAVPPAWRGLDPGAPRTVRPYRPAAPPISPVPPVPGRAAPLDVC